MFFDTLTAVPDATLEPGRVITATSESLTVYVWARVPDFDVLEAAFDDDPSVSSFTVSSETADERSYRMTWNEPIDLLAHIMTKQQGTDHPCSKPEQYVGIPCLIPRT